MQEDTLLKKAKDGDQQAFYDWLQPYQDELATLAYQTGIPKDNLGIIKREVIKELGASLGTVDANYADIRVFETAVRVLEKELSDVPVNQIDTSLKFEEDLETHKAIQELPFFERVAFLLIHFHGKSSVETGEILDKPEGSVNEANESAVSTVMRNLGSSSEVEVQKRLDLLAKSYNRLQFPDDKDHLIVEMIAADEQFAEKTTGERTPINRKSFAILAGASLFLSAVIGASFLFNDQPAVSEQAAAEQENLTTVTTEMVKDWEAEYEEVRASAPERLGLPAETFEQLEYVRKADALKERTFSRQNVKQLQDDPERMQEQVDTLMLSIETPKGMLDSVENYSMLASETSKFLWIYTEKTDQLLTIADGLLQKYGEELSDAEVNGELSAEKLTYSREDYPEEIENLTAALSEYTFNYTVHPNENRFRMVRDVNKFYEIHPFNSDMLSQYYLDILRNAPFHDETGMLWPADQMAYSLVTMTAFLVEPGVDPGLRSKVEPLMIHTFYSVLTGSGHTDVFDSSGVVKEEFQIAWNSLLQFNSNPITFLMLPIIEEFEASGWKESASYDQLAPSAIAYAIEMESNGELVEKLPNGDLKIETVSQDLNDYDYNDIKPLYEEFSTSYDLNALSDVKPMEIIKLYYYANKLEDIETMWHLTADDKLKPSLKEYTKRWKKQPELTETMQNIDIHEGNIHRQGRTVLLNALATLKENDFNLPNMRDIILITERDQIWLMQHQMDEFYSIDDNFEEFETNVQIHYNNLLQSESLKAIDAATPAEIAGVFLLALEKEDVRTMRLLVNKGEVQVSDEEFRERWISSGQFPAYSKVEGISFEADRFNPAINGVQGYVNIYENITTRENSHFLPLEKVEDSWMIGDMFGY